jgi:hypothetical protein
MEAFLFRLLRPGYWIMNYPYSAAWDAFVLQAIANGDVVQMDNYTAKVGGRPVWTENYPHAYGTPRIGAKVRPSAKTIQLLADALVFAGAAE